MFSRIGKIGIVKRATERLSRGYTVREPCPEEKVASKSKRTEAGASDPIRSLEEEEYLIIDIKDDGTPEVSQEILDYNLRLDTPSQVPKKAPADGFTGLTLGDKNFVNVPL